ncbi:hypothetical protein CDV25_08490 [Helicobacter apodemus]|uniref:Uncharacterized protein n=1 Tax=Helicobacter apodemus TaxID=135569 RepID=A0A2U8FFH1_9HELI|nr:hypothetical protein CDV25_08490 [Helicobacter apodemus]
MVFISSLERAINSKGLESFIKSDSISCCVKLLFCAKVKVERKVKEIKKVNIVFFIMNPLKCNF